AFYRRNYRRPTAIFLGQPVAFPSSVGSNHYPRATTTPVSRSACSSTPALWARSNNETAWGNWPLRKNSNRRFARLCLTRRVVDVYRPRKRQLTFLVGGLASLERNLLIWFHNLDYANRRCRPPLERSPLSPLEMLCAFRPGLSGS